MHATLPDSVSKQLMLCCPYNDQASNPLPWLSVQTSLQLDQALQVYCVVFCAVQCSAVQCSAVLCSAVLYEVKR